MLYDYINLDKEQKEPLYIQLYSNIKLNIQNGNIQAGSKLPSIRKLSADLNISKTTVENAYSQLCAEGYITNKPQSGFYTADAAASNIKSTYLPHISEAGSSSAVWKYDFTGKSVDIGDISLKLWKKYIRYIINCDYLITSYGDPQGEQRLRQALSKYSYSVRGVTADCDEIVIGAGTQPLLYILCGILRQHYGNIIAVESHGFSYAERVFADCNYSVVKAEADRSGIDVDFLKNTGARILLINPSGNLQNGKTLKVSRRNELLHWAEENDGIIIEDDYNGELKYSSKPVPAMQGSNKNRVVYIGSFSKLLLPSVRIGYMVLSPELLGCYTANKEKYNQTASKMEQLALAKYISDGQMERSLRRLRKIYKDKSEFTLKQLKQILKFAKVTLLEASLSVNIKLNNPVDLDKLKKLLCENKIKAIFRDNDNSSFSISFSGIEKSSIEKGISIIGEIIKSLAS